MKTLPIILITTIALLCGFFIGAGLGSGLQLRLDMARFSEELRGSHRALQDLHSVPQGTKDSALFTLQGIYSEQQRFFGVGMFSPNRLIPMFQRPSWEVDEIKKNHEYLEDYGMLPDF